MAEPAKDTIFGNLIASLERLHDDLEKVELWLGALHRFEKPVPDYQPNDRYLLPPSSQRELRGSGRDPERKFPVS